MVTSLHGLSQAVSWHVDRAAAKLGEQASAASAVYVFVQTNRFRADDRQYSGGTVIPLTDATDDTRELSAAALNGLKRLYRSGYTCKKCGIMFMELSVKAERQQTLFDNDEARAKSARGMAVMDTINRACGRGTVRSAAIGNVQSWRMRANKGFSYRSDLFRTYLTPQPHPLNELNKIVNVFNKFQIGTTDPTDISTSTSSLFQIRSKYGQDHF